MPVVFGRIDTCVPLAIVDMVSVVNPFGKVSDSLVGQEVLVDVDHFDRDATGFVDHRDNAEVLLFPGQIVAAHDETDAVADLERSKILVECLDRSAQFHKLSFRLLLSAR